MEARRCRFAQSRLIEAGILRESIGQRRDRFFLYERYLDLLNQDSRYIAMTMAEIRFTDTKEQNESISNPTPS